MGTFQWSWKHSTGRPAICARFVQASLRSIKTGKTSDVRFSSTEKIEVVPMMTKKMDFSYKDGDDFVFADPETYETTTLSEEIVGDAQNFLIENGSVTVTFVDEKPVSIEMPSSVILTVKDAPEGNPRGFLEQCAEADCVGDGHHGAGPALHQDGRKDQSGHAHGQIHGAGVALPTKFWRAGWDRATSGRHFVIPKAS